jgi:hypothetical protein
MAASTEPCRSCSDLQTDTQRLLEHPLDRFDDLAMAALAQPGQHLLVIDPAWVNLCQAA